MASDGELAPAADKLVMVVDDDDGVREYLELVVSKEGFRVSTARDGQEGLAKIRDQSPDLVLLDLKLPKYEGLQIVRDLQAAPTDKIPIIIITGHSGDRTTADLVRKEPNVVDLYEKPVNAMALGMNLHALLKTKPATSKKPGAW